MSGTGGGSGSTYDPHAPGDEPEGPTAAAVPPPEPDEGEGGWEQPDWTDDPQDEITETGRATGAAELGDGAD